MELFTAQHEYGLADFAETGGVYSCSSLLVFSSQHPLWNLLLLLEKVLPKRANVEKVHPLMRVQRRICMADPDFSSNANV